MVPPHLVRGLHVGGYEELGRVEIVGEGEALRWEALGTELSVAGVLGALFGARAHAARHAGRGKSIAKAQAAGEWGTAAERRLQIVILWLIGSKPLNQTENVLI